VSLNAMGMKQQQELLPTYAGICHGTNKQDAPRDNRSMAIDFANVPSPIPSRAELCGVSQNIHGLCQGTRL